MLKLYEKQILKKPEEETSKIEQIKDDYNGYSKYIEADDAITAALDLLNRKEQGLIIELPVPIGTTVYSISKDPFEESYYITQVVVGWNDIKWLIDFWGKKVFATTEEANVKMRKLGND